MENASKQPRLLKLIDYHDPRLHSPTQSVKFPLSIEDQQIIQDMIYSIQPEQLKKADAPWESAVGMAANQWGIDKQIFLYCPEGDTVNGLEVIINPSYDFDIDESSDSNQDLEWESCFSVPLAAGHVQRYINIRVTYQNEKGEVLTKKLSGWYARVWQHENDHLNGFLFDDSRAKKCIVKHEFPTKKDVNKFYESLREEALKKNQ